MLKTFKLLLPALIPAWNFFDWIAPSPRIEYALQSSAADTPLEWREFRPRPTSISFHAKVARLFFNPSWNESLFLVSCAERLADAQNDHSVREIFNRIHADLVRTVQPTPPKTILHFRIVFVRRWQDAIVREIAFVASPREIKPDGAA